MILCLNIEITGESCETSEEWILEKENVSVRAGFGVWQPGFSWFLDCGWNLFLPQKGEIENQQERQNLKLINIWKLNTNLNNHQVKEEITRKFKIYFEINENKIYCTRTCDVWNSHKGSLQQ